jgi:DNA-binding MarR family transcriptional regulator
MPSFAGLQSALAPKAGGASSAGELYRLIRYSHIFSAAVREVLELRLLDDIGAEELSLPQFHLLQLITLNGRHQMGEVADFLGVSPPAATKNIDKLERLGLVARTPCAGDRRATLLASSRKGRQLVRRFESLKRERLEPLLAAFTNDEREQLVGLLERFATALIASDADHDGLCLRCSAYFDDDCPIQHLHSGCPYRKIRSRKHESPVEARAGETQAQAN